MRRKTPINLVALDVSHKLLNRTTSANPKLRDGLVSVLGHSMALVTYLFRHRGDKSLVVRYDDDTSVPCLECYCQSIKTLNIQMISRLV